jgi:FemAB-related protein (PEP-CTERM system-associated)
MNVRPATERDRCAWSRWLGESGLGGFYHEWAWLDLNRSHFGHEVFPLLAEDQGTVVGVLPLVRVRSRLFGDILCSMPFVNYGGPVGDTPAVEDALARAAAALALEQNCDYLELRATRPFEGFLSSTHKVSMVVDLPGTPDELWDSFSSKHRTNVRRVYKDEVRTENGGRELLDPFYRLMERSWRALGTPLYGKAYFEALLEAFPSTTRIFVAYSGDEPVAAALNGEAGGRVEGLWAAADPGYRATQPNYVLYWEMLEDACRRGFRTYHLGRSTAGSGAARFKEKWGATPRQLYWNHYLVRADSGPNLSPDNPRFRLAIETWRRLPAPILRVLGPPIARLIP